MATLHTVNKSPFETGALLSCLNHCKPGDAVVLIEDGVYGALDASTVAEPVRVAATDAAIFALDGDVKARGIAGRMMGEVEIVDYEGFVDLVVNYDRTQAWL
ncbi:MAG: sulfurtransferase complex subunit TusB [Rhodobacteraceae bacterium]|nr:sulfurtransferase complex subunit TusB [Paracoccaceae bacterium]